MVAVTPQHMSRLNELPQNANDGGKAFGLPSNLSPDDQLLYVVRDPGNHNVGWMSYRADIMRRLLNGGANPYSVRPTESRPDKFFALHMPRNYTGQGSVFASDIAGATTLGQAILSGNRAFIGLLAEGYVAAGRPPVLSLQDGSTVDALGLATVLGASDTIELHGAKFLEPTDAMSPEHSGKLIARLVELHQVRAVTFRVDGAYFRTLAALLDLGAVIDPSEAMQWRFADGAAKLALPAALVAAAAGDPEQRWATFSSMQGQSRNWPQEMARKSDLVAIQLSRLIAQGFDITGDTRKRGRTILHRAAETAFVSCLELLLRHQADPTQKNAQGMAAGDLPDLEPNVFALLAAARARHAIDTVTNTSAKARRKPA